MTAGATELDRDQLSPEGAHAPADPRQLAGGEPRALEGRFDRFADRGGLRVFQLGERRLALEEHLVDAVLLGVVAPARQPDACGIELTQRAPAQPAIAEDLGVSGRRR